MAATRETLRLAQGVRVTISAEVDAATRQVARAWAQAWTIAAKEWRDAVTALAGMNADGSWPTPAQLAREGRAERALIVTRALLDELAQKAGVTVVQSAEQAIAATLERHDALAASQLPSGLRTHIAGTFTQVNADAVASIVNRVTQQITSTFLPLSAAATDAIREQLIRGVLVGANPRAVARAMVGQVHGAFNGGLIRANVVARTEVLDAHRAAGQAWDVRNRDVIAGWQWLAVLDERTCPSCWVQHGSEHPADESGPDDHPQGRCARVPLARSWADLGIAIPEPPSLVPDARATFDAMPEAAQVAVMGPRRLELYQSGAVPWSALSQERPAGAWRRSYAPTPVHQLAALADAAPAAA